MIPCICDRCGELYKREGTSRRFIEITHDLHPYPTRTLTLCDKCQKELLDWLAPYITSKTNGAKNIYTDNWSD